MTKKFLAAIILTFALFIAGEIKVEAAEVYVGSYSDGTSVYLLTHTVSGYPRYGNFTCRVRAGGDYLDYKFYMDEERTHKARYENSEGYSGFVFDGSSPVAANIYRYVSANY